MAKQKDELITGSELSRRIGTTPQYINNQKAKLKNCKYGKKYYFRKSCLALGYDPDNLNKNIEKDNKVEEDQKQEPKQTIEKQKEKKPKQKEDKQINLGDIDTLYQEILAAISDEDITYDKLKLDGLNLKAKALKEFELATAQRLKNKQLEENLYSIDEVLNIINVSTAIFRNALIDLPNNLAGTLEGLTKKQIKDNVSDTVNDILEDFNKTAEKFK